MTTVTSTNPRTGEVLGTFPEASAEDVGAAIARARKAQEGWAALGHEGRRPHLSALQRALVDQVDRLGSVISAETGREVGEAIFTEVAPAAAVAKYTAKNAARILASRKASTWPLITKQAWVRYQPLGVAAVITPWNYPFLLSFNPTITALAAGCTVVLKPSDVTATAGHLVKDLAYAAGLPGGVVEVVHGGGPTGAALVEAGVDIVSFTGSSPTAREVAAAAARHLIPLILELGGNDAFVVLEDANLKRAARGAVWGAMLNAGQTCIAVERIYVVESVYDRFLAELDKQVNALSSGTGDRGDIGPLTFPPQVAVIDRHLDDARSKGASVVRGGSSRPAAGGGIYYEPTIVTGVDHTMDIMREETFGPVLAVMRVASEQAALELANDSSYGLHGSVWTRNTRRGLAFAEQMRTGTVAVNDVMMNVAIPDLPFGGVGESGYGSNWGPEGLRTFCHPQTFTAPRIAPPTELWWFPRRVGPRLWKRYIRTFFRR